MTWNPLSDVLDEVVERARQGPSAPRRALVKGPEGYEVSSTDDEPLEALEARARAMSAAGVDVWITQNVRGRPGDPPS